MSDLISRQAAIDVLDVGAELLRRVLDNTDIVGAEREKYGWGLRLIELYISGMKDLPSAQPEYYDYSDIDYVWDFYAKEKDINLTDGAKQLKDAMWVGYRKGKQSAQPERKKGKWIRENIVLTSNPPQYQWHCSECGRLVHWFSTEILTNFCPNCGADMRGEDYAD